MTIKLFIIGAALLFTARIGQHSPGLAYLFLAVCIAAPYIWRFALFACREFFIGLFIGEGVKTSGVLKQLRPREPRFRRPPRGYWSERTTDPDDQIPF